MAVIGVEFEKFMGGPIKPPALRMHASIARGGRIQINANLFKRLGKPEAVWLYFNRRTQQIGDRGARQYRRRRPTYKAWVRPQRPQPQVAGSKDRGIRKTRRSFS